MRYPQSRYPSIKPNPISIAAKAMPSTQYPEGV